MKKYILLILLVIPLFSFAQEPVKHEHFIEVTGSAEQEIEPNEITMLIRLREFEENRQKVALEKLDADFMDVIKKAGIDRKRLELADAGSRLDTFRKRDKEAFRIKTYHLKLNSAAELEKFLEKLSAVTVDYVDVIRLYHTDYEKIKLDLKVKALQAAKAKAETLLKSIGAEIGKPIMVRDWEVQPYDPMMEMKSNVRLRAADSMQEADPIGFRKIKLTAQITAQFEIK